MRATFTISQEQVQLSAQQPVRVQDVRPLDHDIAPHDHEFCEVVLVRGGAGVHRTERGRRPLQARDLLVLTPGQIHAYEDVAGLRLFNAYYLAESFVRDSGLPLEAPTLTSVFFGHHLFPERDAVPVLHLSLDPHRFRLLEREWAWLAGLRRSDHPTAAVLRRASWLKCLALVAEDAALDALVAESPLAHPLVAHVHACVERCLDDGLPADVARWAQQAGCSADHLGRIFRRHTGEGPSAYHQRRRLQRAADILIHSDRSLTELAIGLGFSDSAHFSRSFRVAYAMAPSDYRKRFR